MNRILTILVLIILCGCSNELTLTGEYKDIPIVYGLLSPIDTAQYIRVERAFIDPAVSAVEIAQNPDSIYYENATVKLIRESDGSEYLLERVDGSLEGYPRQDGAFVSNPNYLYKIRTEDIPLEGGERFGINISRGDGLPEVTASTTIVEPILITQPSSFSALSIVPESDSRFSWVTNETSFVYDLKMYFHYLEKDLTVANSIFEERTAIWDIRTGVPNPESGDDIKLEIPGEEFYSFLLGQLTPGDDFDRRAINADVALFVGGEELATFQSVAAANTGITSSQDIPIFSNLSEGRGIFSSRTIQTRLELELSPPMLDTLRNGAAVSDLNFN